METEFNIHEHLKIKSLNFYCGENTPPQTNSSNYRTVFDENEISLIFVDFIFYNKKFDEINWEAMLKFKAFRIEEGKKSFIVETEVCTWVTSTENTKTEQASYGCNFEGEFWTKGEYQWEVYFNNTLLIENRFIVEDFGKVTREKNPYFDFLNMTAFEGPSIIPPRDERNYFSKFQQNATRFIWTEFEIQNLHPDVVWTGEFIFSYYNELKELIGRVEKTESIVTVNKNNAFTVFAGIGHETQITWEKDIYTVEVQFMGVFIASIRFEVAEEPNRTKIIMDAPNSPDKNPAIRKEFNLSGEKQIFKELDELIGLDDVKKKIKDYYFFMKYLNLRKEKGIEEDSVPDLNFVFSGSPGTGKTTVAKLMGKILFELGLLSKNSVFEVDRGDLIGRYIGETAPQTTEIINKARGGVLFIDEAYSLYRGEDDQKDFGREAIEILLKEMSDGPGDLSIIVSGYPKEMEELLNSNPGLKSRFNHYFLFLDYNPKELLEISQNIISRKQLLLNKTAKESLYNILTKKYRERDKSFGNARLVNSIIDEAHRNMALRIMNLKNPEQITLKEISTFEYSDFANIEKEITNNFSDIRIDEALLKSALTRLNALTGLNNVKSEIREIVKLVRYYKESNINVLNSMSLHNVFTGNPGTGKTTIARIIADIYKSLGLLERGHLIECSRESLVAGYVGQTAIKTEENIARAMGGVLFIDEAYSLVRGDGTSDFGSEAIEVLLKAMEDNRGKFSIIAAGYTNEMFEFLESNSGLKSRFDRVIEFEDYSDDELFEILLKEIETREMVLEIAAMEHISGYIKYQANQRDRFFGNARFIRKLVSRIIRNQNLRLAEIEKKKRSKEMLQTIIIDDVKDLDPYKEFINKTKPEFGF